MLRGQKRRVRSYIFLSSSLFFLVACVAPQNDSSASTDEAIRGGAPEANEPAVGLVLTGSGYCTGTLIAPNVVLTAGHCVRQPVRDFVTTAGSIDPTVHHRVKAQLAHPSYSPGGGCPNSTLDIGLLELEAPATGITPKTFGGAPTAGSSCRAVGFGRHQNGATLERERSYAADETILSVAIASFQVTTGTGIADKGDSGGPLLCNDSVVGAVSCHTDGEGAAHMREHYALVDGAANWITIQIAQWSTTP